MFLIGSTEKQFFKTESIDELSDIHFHLVDTITKCLDKAHHGYRYTEGTEEYDSLMKRFDKYNVVYCNALGRFNSELLINGGNEDKIVHVIALLKRMEHQALTARNGFNPNIHHSNTVSNDNLSKRRKGETTEDEFICNDNDDFIMQKRFLRIKRNIDGAVLAKSTKQDIIELFNRKNSAYQITDNGVTIRSKDNVKFGGINWDEVCYVFVRGMLFKVVYIKSGPDKYEEIISDGNYLHNNLYDKYRHFYIPNSNSSFSDGITEIYLFESYLKDRPGLCLQYFDSVKDVHDHNEL